MDTPGHTGECRVSQARVVFGLVVMLVGPLFLLDRLDWWGVRLNVPIWPWVLVVLGLVRLSDVSPDARGAGAAGVRRRGCCSSAPGDS